MIATLTLVLLAQTYTDQRIGPGIGHRDFSLPPERPHITLLSLDGGAPAIAYTVGSLAEAQAVWFKVGATSPDASVDVVYNQGADERSATIPVQAHRWNRWQLPTPAFGGSGLSLTARGGVSIELENFADGTWRNDRDDLSGGGSNYDIFLPADGGVVMGTASFVIELTTRGDQLAPGCPSDVPQVVGNAYTHYERRPLVLGQTIQTSVIASPGTKSNTPRPILGRLWVPLQFDGGTKVSYVLASRDAGSANGMLSAAPNEHLGAEWTMGVELAEGTLDAGEGTLALTLTAGQGSVYYAATGLDPNGPCGAISRASWRGTNAGEWIPDAGHFDLAFLAYEHRRSDSWFDRDGDGAGDPTAPWGLQVAGVTVPQKNPDCDDTNPNISPFAPEVCNRIDDNCNGLVDDEMTLVLGSCALDAGVCGGAKQTAALCIDGGWAACGHAQYGVHFEPVESSCDGLDNDCDGIVDDTVDGPLCTLQAGVCAGRRASRCVTGMWATCTLSDLGPLYEPNETACDGLDNDCNGQVDDFVALPLCTSQQGVCAGQRTTSCTNGAPGACAAPGYEASEQSCDGKDNDCDGKVDEGCVSMPPLGTEEGMPPKTGCASVAGMPLVLLALAWRRRFG